MDKPYRITRQNVSADNCGIEARIDPEHPVFKGHFPGKPVLPGVYYIELVKDCLKAVGYGTRLERVSQMKLPAMLEMNEPRIVEVMVEAVPEGDRVKVNASARAGETVLFRMKDATFCG